MASFYNRGAVSPVLLFFFSVLLLCHAPGRLTACPISGDSIVCENEIVSYTSTTTGTGYTYQWTAFGGAASGSASATSVTWTGTGSGQLSLVVRDAFNVVVCTSLMNVTIHPNPKPVITPSFVSGCGIDSSKDAGGNKREPCYTVCDSQWVTYITPNHSGSSYAWTISGAATIIPSTSNTIQVYWTSPGPGTVTVTETDANGCIGIAKICVTVVAKPTAQFTTMPAPVSGIVNVCLNQQVQFINQSSAGTGSPLYNYTWIFGDGNSETIAAPDPGHTTHAYATTGTYTVMLITENECHCKDTAILTVIVDANPGPDIFCVSTVCPGTPVTYSTSASCPGYDWDVVNGTIIGSDTSQSVTVNWGTTGPGYLTLSTVGCPGLCPSPTTILVPIIPSTVIIGGPSSVCLYDCKKYHISCDIPVDSIVWHFPPGVTVNTDTINEHEVQVCFYDPTFTTGTITVDYYHHTPGAEGLSCGGTATLNISVKPKLQLFYPSTICDNTTLTGSYTMSTGGGNLQWVITGITGSPTYYTNTQSASLPFSVPWTWGPGQFLVTVNDVDTSYCNGPQSFPLTVNPIPPLPDTLTGPMYVCPNQAYQYVGFSTSGNYTLAWSFTNGTPTQTVGNTASVIWGPSGPYIINLYQIDPNGCKSQALTVNVTSILPMTASVITGPDTVCANSDTTYSTTSPGDDFTWSISPSTAGSVSGGQGTPNISVQWNNYVGTATITLVREACGSSISTNYTVVVTAPPLPVLTVPSSICQGSSASMSASAPGATFAWAFGDGGTGSGSSVSHVYNTVGNHTVTVTATYSGTCVGTATATATIMVYPKPNVSISTPDPNIFCGPVSTVNMFVAAPVSGTLYQWYQSPSTFLTNDSAYSTNIIGLYYVVATNSFGCKDTSNTILIDTTCGDCVPDPSYSVGFTFSRIGCNKDTFTGTYTSGAGSPTWNFDDPFGSPNVAFGNNASHTFPEPGYYRINFCVNVPDTSSTDSCRICAERVDSILYIPDFFDSMFCVNGLDSIKIKFINNTKILSTAPLPGYAWSINGGSTVSTATNPVFTLPPGTHTITLTVNGVCSVTKTVVVPGFPNASFTAVDSICVGAPVYFTNSSTGLFTSVLWKFGDGATSLINDPVRTYSSSGTYSVTLLIYNSSGCKDSITKSIVVLPNTLTASITPLSDTVFCEGDSVILVSSVSGGYPAYTYLWSNTQTTANISAYYTGNYYLEVSDSKGCQCQSNKVNVLVNPTPTPNINGPLVVCMQTLATFSIGYPSSSPGGYSMEWWLDGASMPWATMNTFNYFANTPGNHVIAVWVKSPEGCIGYDTLKFKVVPNPTVGIIAASTLCEGESHLLIGITTSTNVMAAYWNTGSTNDSIYVSAPGNYIYTVVDSSGCQNSTSRFVHRLPDFCGLMTGCYEICDTIKELVWHAPQGYASYQWLYNNSPISGATSDTLHIPLYQSGNYQVVITTANGCTDTSDIIDIEFIKCDCTIELKDSVHCGPVSQQGFQTYTFTWWINNTLSAGAGVSVTSPNGTITGLTPGTLGAGLNTVTATFTDIPPQDSIACFTIVIFNGNERCDTTYCIKLPECDGDCKEKIDIKEFDCAGYDVNGNPLYYVCVNVNWGGSSGSTLTVTTASGTFVPSPVTINSGSQLLCFTYTDLPPHSGFATFYFHFYDPVTGLVCRDSIKRDYRPCPDSCSFGIYGACAHCEDDSSGGFTYHVELTVHNMLGTPANATILPITAGTFGSITPNPVPPGMQTIDVPFTDNNPRDSIICFRVLLSNAVTTCWQDVCIYLPDCSGLGIEDMKYLSYFSLYPNPAKDQVNINYRLRDGRPAVLVVSDISGREIARQKLGNNATSTVVNTSRLSGGMYFVTMVQDGLPPASIKLIITR